MKEFYFYLHSTPTHSYLKYLYNYPQVRYPYADLVEASRRRMKNDTELQTDPYWRDNIYSMNTSMATMVPGWAPITRPVGQDSWPNSLNSLASSTPRGSWE